MMTTFFTIIGFIAAVLAGLYLTFAPLIAFHVTSCFGGKLGRWDAASAAVVFSFGALILYGAFSSVDFSVSLK